MTSSKRILVRQRIGLCRRKQCSTLIIPAAIHMASRGGGSLRIRFLTVSFARKAAGELASTAGPSQHGWRPRA